MKDHEVRIKHIKDGFRIVLGKEVIRDPKKFKVLT